VVRVTRITVILILLAVPTTSGQVFGRLTSGPVAITPAAARLLLALDRLQAIRWYPSTPRLRRDAAPDEALLQEALTSADPELRRIAVRGAGRFEYPPYVSALTPFLADADTRVRREAAHAIAQSVEQLNDAGVMAAYDALKLPTLLLPAMGQSSRARADQVAAEEARLEALTRLHYTKPVAQQVLQQHFLNPLRVQYVLNMVRRYPGLELSEGLVSTLTFLAKPRDPRMSASAAALEVLIRTGHVNKPLIAWAAQYRHPEDKPPYPNSAMRELAVGQLEADDPVTGPVLEMALKDLWPVVRVRALRRVAEAIPRTKRCEPLLDALRDGGELAMVKIEALALLDPRCDEREAATRIAREYSAVADAGGPQSMGWPLRARAIETLAALDPEVTREVLDKASPDVWQVRAARARAAHTLGATDRLREYMNDDDPNVRTEALSRLSQLSDVSVTDFAFKALSSPDYQLVLTAARIVGLSEAPRDRAVFELWSAFKRLTLQARDTSRFPRLAILEAMQRWAPPRDNVAPVQPYLDDLRAALRDTDPVVAEAAAEVIEALTTVKPPVTPTYRPPQQPDEADLTGLPISAVIGFENGDEIHLAFLTQEAPLAVARFVSLVKDGYYRDLPFAYRVVPLVALHGGSADGNDLSGDVRFLRDEISIERHIEGVVGLLSHGRDTADGRFFIDLADQPGFDYQYTLFARVGQRRISEAWPYFRDPLPPVSVFVRGGAITTIRLIYQ